ncbi:MAG: hypothetical protein J6P58_06305 [Oscillospiraceae bacterium]|nr:hypothetical protein [Oscillospiraceae bacterium]
MLALRKGGHRDLERLYSAFELDFDRRELLPKLAIHKAMTLGDQELLVFYDEESGITAGYALVMVRGVYGYVLLKYFGILQWFREQGLGIQAMRLINKRYADRQGILAELTVFDDAEGDYLRKLRKFFSRFGYVDVACDYRLGGAKVDLMVKPIKGSADIAPVAHRMITDFYSRCLRPAGFEKMIDIRPAKREE